MRQSAIRERLRRALAKLLPDYDFTLYPIEFLDRGNEKEIGPPGLSECGQKKAAIWFRCTHKTP